MHVSLEYHLHSKMITTWRQISVVHFLVVALFLSACFAMKAFVFCLLSKCPIHPRNY